MSLHPTEHPFLVGVPGVVSGGAGLLWARFGELHPTVQGFLGVLSAAVVVLSAVLMAAARLYKPTRNLFAAIRAYVDPKEGVAAQAAAASSKKLDLLSKELSQNTVHTHAAHAQIARLGSIVADAVTSKDMIVRLEGSMMETREDFARLGATMVQTFDRLTKSQEKFAERIADDQEKLRAEFNGFRKSIEAKQDDFEKRMEAKQKEYDARLAKVAG